jgi:hypothetical protein
MLTLLLAMAATPGATDFGIRAVGQTGSVAVLPELAKPARQPLAVAPARFSLTRAASIGSRLGRVTSTIRSAAHNRRVGGAANSWHLHGRAIDIARAPGVTHAQIAAELRRAGFFLIESLDEGDHSHFAFTNGPVNRMRTRPASEQLAELRQEASYFRFVTVPRSARGSLR